MLKLIDRITGCEGITWTEVVLGLALVPFMYFAFVIVFLI